LIGTNSPSEILSVITGGDEDSAGKMVLSAGSGLGNIHIDPSAGASSWTSITQAGDAAIIFSDGLQNTGGLVIAPWNNTGAGLRMNSAGNVGASSTGMDIEGNNAALYVLRNGGTPGTNGLKLEASSANNYSLATVDANNLHLGTNNTNRVTIDTSGCLSKECSKKILWCSIESCV
jgi:hypothetical protein